MLVTPMRIGAGIRVRNVRNAQYMIYWCYEREGGRSVKHEKYLGRMDDPEARATAAQEMLHYLFRCRRELDDRIAAVAEDLQGTAAALGEGVEPLVSGE